MLECQRDLFTLRDDVHYLNCASKSPLLRASEEASMRGLMSQRLPEGTPPADYFAEPDRLRELFAQLIHCDPVRVAIAPSVSYGLSIATHNLRLRPDQNVVVVKDEFPSIVYASLAANNTSGGQLRTVPRESTGSAWTGRLIEAIDTATGLVSLSPVHWMYGTRFDLQAVADRCRETGTLLVIDGTQYVGAVPFDFAQVQPDLLVVASYKWLFGPYQLGLAVVGDRLLDGVPFEHHWSPRAGSEDTSNLIYEPRYREGARRFDVGEFNNPITVPSLNAGLEQVLAWTPAAIQEYCGALANRLMQQLDDSRYSLPPAEDRYAHILGISLKDPGRIVSVVQALSARNVRVSKRGPVLRVSPHVYNTTDDIDALAKVLNAN
tara:strand:- start:6333 stop:7466 length:1134 start_codon:yes stop_codon:yes gene_type:complete